MAKEQYFGVYKVLKNGKHQYIGRTATASRKLAEEIAAERTRGEVTTPTGKVISVPAVLHIVKPI
jgi:hypothetical protein